MKDVSVVFELLRSISPAPNGNGIMWIKVIQTVKHDVPID